MLSVVRVASFDDAVRVNNGVRYGLSSSIYTSNVDRAFRALSCSTTASRTSTPRPSGRRRTCRSAA